METIIIVSLASLGLLVLLGCVLMFSHLCGLAGHTLVSTLLKTHAADAPPPSHSAQPPASLSQADIDALLAESQKMLQQSEARAALRKHEQAREATRRATLEQSLQATRAAENQRWLLSQVQQAAGATNSPQP